MRSCLFTRCSPSNKTRTRDRCVIQSYRVIVNVRRKSTHGVALEWNTVISPSLTRSLSLARPRLSEEVLLVLKERLGAQHTRTQRAKRCTCNPRCSLADVRIVWEHPAEIFYTTRIPMLGIWLSFSSLMQKEICSEASHCSAPVFWDCASVPVFQVIST